MFNKRILLYTAGIAIIGIISVYLLFFKKMAKQGYINLDQLISFQQKEDPVFINDDLAATKEWTCDRTSVVPKERKPYRWKKDNKLKSQGKTFRGFEVDQLLFTPVDRFSPVIVYLTPSKEVYDSIVHDAKEAMTINKESVLNGNPFYDFTNADVAVQAGSAGDHFSVLVMNRIDYDRGLRFN